MVWSVSPCGAQNLAKIAKNFFFDPKISPTFFLRRKIKRWESSETRFPKFSRRSEACSGGKRPFKVSENFRDSRKFFERKFYYSTSSNIHKDHTDLKFSRHCVMFNGESASCTQKAINTAKAKATPRHEVQFDIRQRRSPNAARAFDVLNHGSRVWRFENNFFEGGRRGKFFKW